MSWSTLEAIAYSTSLCTNSIQDTIASRLVVPLCWRNSIVPCFNKEQIVDDDLEEDLTTAHGAGEALAEYSSRAERTIVFSSLVFVSF